MKHKYRAGKWIFGYSEKTKKSKCKLRGGETKKCKDCKIHIGTRHLETVEINGYCKDCAKKHNYL